MKTSTAIIVLNLLLAGVLNAQNWQPVKSISRNGGGEQSTLRIEVRAQQGKQNARGTEAPTRGFRITTTEGEVLAFSEESRIDTENMPPALQEWLQWVGTTERPLRTEETVVTTGPLMQTLWDQSTPFNDSVPLLNNGSRAATGCVATSTAQVFYFHKYPQQGRGSNSYLWNGTMLSRDFSLSTYDWEAMQPVYSDTSSVRSRSAVAILMRDIGYAMQMDYGPSSAANSQRNALAMREYFGYNTSYAIRSAYSYADWEALISGEIFAGRPVIYDGFSSGGGHSFVIDGYRSDGYFHVNWGWGGTSNGWFRITRLNPSASGIGAGTDDGYNEEQGAIIGIAPAAGGNAREQLGVLACDSMQISASYNHNYMATLYGLQNISIDSYSGNLVLMLLGADGNPTHTLGRADVQFGWMSYRVGNTYIYFSLPNLPEGTYTVRLYSENTNSAFSQTPVPVRGPLSTMIECRLELDTQGNINWQGTQAPHASFDTISCTQSLYNGHLANISYDLHCGTTEYYDSIGIYLKSLTNGATYRLVGEIADVLPGVPFHSEVMAAVEAPVGNYRLCGFCQQQDSRTEWEGATVSVGRAPQGTIEAIADPQFADNRHVNPHGDNLTVPLRLASGTVWSGTIYWNVSSLDEDGISSYTAGTSTVRLDAGDTLLLHTELSIPLPPGNYMLTGYANPYNLYDWNGIGSTTFHLDRGAVWTPDSTERPLSNVLLDVRCNMPDTCYQNGYLPLVWAISSRNDAYEGEMILSLVPKSDGNAHFLLSRYLELQQDDSLSENIHPVINCAPGDYYVISEYYRNDSLITDILDSVTVAATSEGEVWVTNPRFHPDNGNVPQDNASITLRMKLNPNDPADAVWSGEVEVWVTKLNPYSTSDQIIRWGETHYMDIPKAGDWKEFIFKGDLPIPTGQYEIIVITRRATVLNRITWWKNSWTFTLTEGRGEDVELGIEHIATELPGSMYYDLLGRPMGTDSNALPSGMYIIGGKKVMIEN